MQQALKPCPFCEGPPTDHIEIDYKQIPADCAYANAFIFCHECGAQGPRAEGVVCNQEDGEELINQAKELWHKRDNRHRYLYDSSEKETLEI